MTLHFQEADTRVADPKQHVAESHSSNIPDTLLRQFSGGSAQISAQPLQLALAQALWMQALTLKT